jgi:hypothetical protein
VQKPLESAANCLVLIDFDKFTELSDPVLSTQDMALYGTLCALGSFSREDLKAKVIRFPAVQLCDTLNQLIDNRSFQNFLQTSSQVKSLVNCFFNCRSLVSHIQHISHWRVRRYPELMKQLNALTLNWLQYDPHVGVQASVMIEIIRAAAMIQYVDPYLTVVLPKMSAAFDCTVLSTLL